MLPNVNRTDATHCKLTVIILKLLLILFRTPCTSIASRFNRTSGSLKIFHSFLTSEFCVPTEFFFLLCRRTTTQVWCLWWFPNGATNLLEDKCVELDCNRVQPYACSYSRLPVPWFTGTFLCIQGTIGSFVPWKSENSFCCTSLNNKFGYFDCTNAFFLFFSTKCFITYPWGADPHKTNEDPEQKRNWWGEQVTFAAENSWKTLHTLPINWSWRPARRTGLSVS